MGDLNWIGPYEHSQTSLHVLQSSAGEIRHNDAYVISSWCNIFRTFYTLLEPQQRTSSLTLTWRISGCHGTGASWPWARGQFLGRIPLCPWMTASPILLKSMQWRLHPRMPRLNGTSGKLKVGRYNKYNTCRVGFVIRDKLQFDIAYVLEHT